MDLARALRRQRRGSQRGDAIVELALLVPLLMLMLFGVLELGRVVDAWIVVNNAAREGAREAAMAYPDSVTTSTGQSAALAYLNSGLAPRGDIAQPIPTPVVQLSSDSVEVTAKADVQLYTPLFQALLGGQVVHVVANATMRRQ
jgi:Flp pilus assembly protein TadG